MGLGMLAACVLLELVLHITDPTDYNRFENDPVSGLLHYKRNYSFPDAESCYYNDVKTNSLGLHAAEPPVTPKSPKDFRIVITGSSFAEAASSPVDKTPAANLERLLNAQQNKKYNYEVTSVAFSGNGTYLDLLYYLRYGQPLHPDLVINITTEYEHGRDAPTDTHRDTSGNLVTTLPAVGKNSTTAQIKDVLRKSKLVMNLFNRYLVLKNSKVAETVQHSAKTDTYQATEWNNDDKLVAALADQVAADKAHFILASWATPFAATSTVEAMSEHYSAGATKNNFTYINLQPSMDTQAKASGIGASWSCDPHWSPAGNAYAAQGIFDYLQSHTNLLTKKL